MGGAQGLALTAHHARHEAIGGVGLDIKTRLPTGTVASTDNRNWEFRYEELYERFSQSRAIAVDMESATIGVETLRVLEEAGIDALHSRKLRSFDEPAFR